jgi:glycosyltransferase involved in cell wall biosynthesis
MPIYKCRTNDLRTSLSTLLNQSYDNLDIILVLDLSNTLNDSAILDTLDEFKDDHRIRTIVRKVRKGYCNALNTGVRLALGEFIARLDSDDYCDITRIERQMRVLLSGKIVLAGTWAHVVDEQNREIGQVRTPASSRSIRDLIMLHNPFVHSSIVFAKHVIEETGLYNEAFEGAEDYELYLRIIAKGYRSVNVPQFLTFLRFTRDSITRGEGWMKTREKYFRAKCEGVIQLKFRKPLDILYAMASPITMMITPEVGLRIKKAVGWYSQQNSTNRSP